ncbi:SatD family protein [Desmospora activa]|uniref:SatD family protein n=1 Tax=Desmospora activa DSM 45169 TaxID=1121389 RepID=A0A2T4ZBY9_9BACL|nr:SatD family protein [Desmospora activa]PTM59386.1 SatD family protein [Desmospora activa DSM 45169]
MPQTCICIAGDVKKSRQMEGQHLITALQQCEDKLNKSFSEELLIPFAVRNGDEIVGVLKEFPQGYLAAKTMMEELRGKGIHLYIGLGLGELESTQATIHTMNGTAVYHAFQARDHFLKQQHQQAKPWLLGEDASSFFFYDEAVPYQALNALTYSIWEKIVHRSEKQQNVIRLIQENPQFSYEQIGKKLGYKSAKSTVSYLLSRAHYPLVQAMEASLMQLLHRLQAGYLTGRS